MKNNFGRATSLFISILLVAQTVYISTSSASEKLGPPAQYITLKKLAEAHHRRIGSAAGSTYLTDAGDP